jgi:hypothetical protein
MMNTKHYTDSAKSNGPGTRIHGNNDIRLSMQIMDLLARTNRNSSIALDIEFSQCWWSELTERLQVKNR